MRYFSGFGLHGDYTLFAPLLYDFGYMLGVYDIVGFSSGALVALQYAMQRIIHKKRVGRVILLSPLLYTHHISKDSILNLASPDLISPCAKTSISQNSNKSSFNNYSIYGNKASNDLYYTKDIKTTQIITHVNFESFIREFSHINIDTLWNLFKKICVHSYNKDKFKYHNIMYKLLGFNITHKNTSLYSFNNKECSVFTHFEKPTTLKNILEIRNIDLEKIKEKSQNFVAFIAEHDRITNSKLISSYLSQFGICYILKGRNHILQKIT